MIYQPSGFDQYLAELAELSEEELADKAAMKALNDRFDIVTMGKPPPRPS